MVDLYRFNPFRQGVDMYSGGLESEGWELLSNHENCSAAYAHRQRFVGETAAPPRPGSAGRSPLHPAYGGYSPRKKSDLAEPWMRRSPSDRQLDQLASSDGQRRARSQSPRTHSPRKERMQRRQQQQQLQRPATPNHDVGDEQQHSPLRQHGAQEAAAAPTFRKSANVRELNLLQSFGQAVICTDLQGIITFWNRAAETLYGWRGEEVVGVSVLNVLIPSRLIKEAADIISRVGQGDSWTGRYPCLRRDGVVLDTVVTKSPIVDDNGTIVGVIGSSIDAKSISTDKSSLSRAYADEWPKSDLDARCCEEYDQHGRWSPRAADAHSRFPTDAAQTTDDSSKGSSKSLLQRLGCTSVQQILRKFNFRGYKSSDDSCAQSQQSKGKEQRAYSSESGSSQSRFSSAYRDDCSLDMREHMLSVSGQRPWTHTASESCNNHAIASAASNHSLGYPLGTDVNVLSRTSSGSTGGSPMAASVAGSPNGSVPNSGALSAAAGGSVNFQQAEEDFQLQLALALRVAAEAAAIDDPDLVANLRGPIGGTRMMPGVSKIESIAYRYWVSNCLSYDDHIEDGFFEIWGMSPYVWSMCTDSNELGRMPPLESLRSVHPADAVFEVVLVDRSLDPELCGLEDKAVGLAYDCTEVLDLARKLGKLVATVMGGAAASDEVLLQAWKSCSAQVMQVVSSIVIPIGKLKTGLCRHRALLFKVLADSVGLSCRLVRGSSYCGREDDAMVVVKCGDDKEWMIDLLANPGHIMPPDARLSAPPAVIASPLQFDRASPFAGSSISVMDWARPELGSSAVPSSSAAGEQAQASVPVVSNIAFRTTVIEPNGTMSELPVEKEGKWQIPLARGLPDEEQVGPVGNAGSNHDDRFCKNNVEQKLKVGQRAADGVNAPGTPKGHSGQELEANPVKAGRADDGSPRLDTSRWALEDMRHYIESGGASNTLKSSVVKRMLVNAEDLEIPWEDMSIGERIGQGSYGKVYRGDWQGSDVAVKVFLDQDLKLEALEEFRSEVAIMRRLRHPNIVLFMGAVMRPPNLSIVTEFCPRGSLFRLLHRPNRELDERRRIRMALDVVKGMNYLHRCSPPVVHRDLKSPNLLVDKNWTVKVCDFGLSRQKSSTFLSSKSSAGTPEWMAPEVLRNEPSDEKSDIYSFGVILWELATLQVPWAGLSPIQVVGAVGFQHRRLPIPDTVDPTIAAIIQACWRMDPKTRPSFADIMQELKPLQRTQQNSPTQKRPTSPDATELERA